MTLRVIIVQSEMQSAQPLTRYFKERGDEVWQAWELGQAGELIEQIKPHLMLMDLHFASGDWINFLRRVRIISSETRIIMTNKYPDLQREMLVRDLNVQVFLRQPFSTHWIEQALKRLDAESHADWSQREPTAEEALAAGPGKELVPNIRPVRLPLWAKITMTYLLLVLLFALATQAMQVGIFVLAAVGALLVLLIGLTLAHRITSPVLRMVKAAGQVAQGNLEVKLDASGDDEIALLSQSFNYMVAGLQEGTIYRDLLGRTVNHDVRDQLRQTVSSGSVRLEGQQVVSTVLMSDIRGFTQVDEKADPATVFQWLNEYYALIAPIVAAHDGVINTFEGDAMLAFFGVLPRVLNPRQGAVAACEAAREILQAIDQLNAARAERGEPPLITGIGVNTGSVLAGGLGTSDKLHFTIIGDTVNTTQRIEALTRDLAECSEVLVSQATVDALDKAQGRFHLSSLGEFTLRGKDEPAAVYRLDD